MYFIFIEIIKTTRPISVRVRIKMWHPFDVIFSEWWWLFVLGTKRGALIQDLPVTAGSDSRQTTTPDGAVWDGREAETGPAEGAPTTGSGSQKGSECPDPGVEHGEKGLLWRVVHVLLTYKHCIPYYFVLWKDVQPIQKIVGYV